MVKCASDGEEPRHTTTQIGFATGPQDLCRAKENLITMQTGYTAKGDDDASVLLVFGGGGGGGCNHKTSKV